MAINPDYLVDRRRLKRQLTRWRVLAIGAVVVALVIVVARSQVLSTHDHVARITIDGIIVDDRDREEALAKVLDDDHTKALIVRIDSPGGTVVGGESLFRQLREVAVHKPVVAVMGELATSAAYMTAIATDRIFAREGTLTGSIGVILQTTDITKLLESVGIKPETIKSGPLKAQPNPLEPFTKEAREATTRLVQAMFDMFVDMVADRRKMARPAVLALADGRVFTGREAAHNGLIDAIGGEQEARAWLTAERGIAADIPVSELQIHPDEFDIKDILSQVGGKMLFTERLRLDGLIAVWHP